MQGATAAEGGCSFDVEYGLSPKIATVGVVTWSVDFTPEQAHIDFGLAGERLGFRAPVELEAAGYETWLLGMKAERTYAFRIVAKRGTRRCVSEPFELTTGPIPSTVPQLRTETFASAAGEPGFVVTSAGLVTSGEVGVGTPMFVFDADGDIVWYWEETPQGTSRALMDWEGRNMWMLAVNVTGGPGRVSRVSMDGRDFERDVEGLEQAHHDLAALPGGVMAAIAYVGDCSGLVERAPDGDVRVTVPDFSTLYVPSTNQFGHGRECHPNSILYHPDDDTFTLSDRNASAYVKLTRDGALLWQLGGANPLGHHYEASWSANHGHHVLENGNFLLFSNGSGQSSTVLEFRLDAATWRARQVWEYQSELGSVVLGDVQRLSHGHTLVTYSSDGVIEEVDAEGVVVKRYETASLGYAMHRTSLYGPPPK